MSTMSNAELVAAMDCGMSDLERLIQEWEARDIPAEQTLKLKDAYEALMEVGAPMHQELYGEPKS